MESLLARAGWALQLPPGRFSCCRGRARPRLFVDVMLERKKAQSWPQLAEGFEADLWDGIKDWELPCLDQGGHSTGMLLWELLQTPHPPFPNLSPFPDAVPALGLMNNMGKPECGLVNWLLMGFEAGISQITAARSRAAHAELLCLPLAGAGGSWGAQSPRCPRSPALPQPSSACSDHK